MKPFISILSLMLTIPLFAAEADHYTHRSKTLVDVSATINQKANQYLAAGLRESNELGSCNMTSESELGLYTILQKYYANHSKGELAKFALYDKSLPRDLIPLDESVYKDWGLLDGFLLGRKAAAKSPLALAPMIRMGTQVVGTDKLEHMFGMGFIYFNSYYIEGKELYKILKNGILREKTALGGNSLATGVFAYGDLAANFNGMRFWNHFLQKRDDVLGKGHNYGPYVKCRRGKWVAVKPIDFTKYIDESMDESINCSKFATESGLEKFTKVIKSIDKSYACPMVKSANKSLVEKYGVVISSDSKKRTIAHWIINEGTNGTVSYFNEF